MAHSSTNSAISQLESLSLGNDEPSSNQSAKSTNSRPSTGSFDLSFSSPPSSSEQSSSEVFIFGQQPSSSTSAADLSRPKGEGSSSSGNPFCFGSGVDTGTSSPGRQPLFCASSPELSTPSSSSDASSSAQIESSFRFVSTPPRNGPHVPFNSNSPAPLFSLHLLHTPRTPSSVKSSRSLSFTSSVASSPAQAHLLSPNTNESLLSTLAARPSPIVPSYHVEDEVTPPHALFTDTFQKALKDGTKIANDTVDAMERGAQTESDEDFNSLLEDARSLCTFQGTDTRTIAVLGDSGEGKSSLINSLLHFPDIAETGDIGSACTSIVTEYRQLKAEHDGPITIEVEYLSSLEIKELIRELLWSYRQLFLPSVESSDTSEQDYARYTRESEHAWSALNAAFGHKRQFNQNFAQDTSDGAIERITDQLIQWAGEIEWPSNGADGFWTATSQTAEECIGHTKMFMQNKYWPFTKIIRVYLDAHILKTGLVLADLPGLHDTNLARVRATQDYLIKCDNIIIVAKISRAITNQSLKSSLFFALSRHVPAEWEGSRATNFKIAVVCTKSEEINGRVARSEFCGPDKRIASHVMAELDAEIDAAKSSGDRTRKKAAKRRQELLLVQARNSHVKENLQRVYASEMDGRTLPVFCVSNKWYEKYCPKGNTELVQASGIPELRRFCHTITAEAQFHEVNHFLVAKSSALLNSLDLWATRVQNRQEGETICDDSVFTEFDTTESEMSLLVGRFREDFSTCFQEHIMKSFDEREENWKKAAKDQGDNWKEWHWTQYNAWCLNNGDHQTMKRGHENWNTKIIWKMRLELDFAWSLVEEEVADGFSAILAAAMRILKSFKDNLFVLVAPEYASTLAGNIDSRMQSLEYQIKREERDFLRQVQAIRRYTLESNHNSFILQHMVPVYRSATSQFGPGKKARQIEIVQGHIEDDVIFPQLAISISTSMIDLLTTAGSKLDNIVHNTLCSIRTDLDIIFRSQIQSQASSKGFSKERESQIQKLAIDVQSLKQRLKHVLGSIEAL